MLIQKPYKERYKKDLSAPLLQVNLDPGNLWNIRCLIVRNQSSNDTLFAKCMLELHFRIFLFIFLCLLNE